MCGSDFQLREKEASRSQELNSFCQALTFVLSLENELFVLK
jgi:hypothetical protein